MDKQIRADFDSHEMKAEGTEINNSKFRSNYGQCDEASRKRCRALVVDDSVDITMMLDMILRRAGYDTYTAFTGADALRAARSSHFDIILSDIGMPLMNGYELCEELRKIAEYKNVPLIAITGYSYYEDPARANTCGFDLLIKKPINPRDLIDVLNDLNPSPEA